MTLLYVVGNLSVGRSFPMGVTTGMCGRNLDGHTANICRICTLKGRIVSLKQDDENLYYKAAWPVKEEIKFANRKDEIAAITADESSMQKSTETLLRDYLNLEPNLTELYEKWSQADLNFKKRAPKFTGVRILRQDAWETLCAFICSSANNIPRITQMVGNLQKTYGTYIGTLHGEDFHDFPTPDALSGPDTESELRKLGFGYRAKYLAATAKTIAKEKPENWLQTLCNTEPYEGPDVKLVEPEGRPGYRKAHEELVALQGVGPKVADCICLMGMGWAEAVPVDTHVFSIAQKDYKFKAAQKNLNKKMYVAIANHFRQLWGREAGWAHSVLFAADLKTFAVRLVEKEENIKDEVTIKAEGVVVKVEATTKRKAMKEEGIKNEPIEDNEVLSQTRTKRVKVIKSEP